MKQYFIMEKAKWDKNIGRYDVPYIFYGGHARKWRNDMAYLSRIQFEFLRDNGKNVRKFGMKLKTIKIGHEG